jgi:hypothetical protein
MFASARRELMLRRGRWSKTLRLTIGRANSARYLKTDLAGQKSEVAKSRRHSRAAARPGI